MLILLAENWCWSLLSIKLRANGRNDSQHCWPDNVGIRCIRLQVVERLPGFKLCATTLNNMQQGAQTDATYNIQQFWELLANNVGSIRTGL